MVVLHHVKDLAVIIVQVLVAEDVLQDVLAVQDAEALALLVVLDAEAVQVVVQDVLEDVLLVQEHVIMLAATAEGLVQQVVAEAVQQIVLDALVLAEIQVVQEYAQEAVE